MQSFTVRFYFDKPGETGHNEPASVEATIPAGSADELADDIEAKLKDKGFYRFTHGRRKVAVSASALRFFEIS